MANQEFAKYAGSLKPNETVMNLNNEILNDIRLEKNRDTKDMIKKLKEDLLSHQKRIEGIEDKYMDGEIDKSEYSRFMKRLFEKTKEIEQRIEMAESPKRLNLEPKLTYSISL